MPICQDDRPRSAHRQTGKWAFRMPSWGKRPASGTIIPSLRSMTVLEEHKQLHNDGTFFRWKEVINSDSA
jgi:hypothetical protein